MQLGADFTLARARAFAVTWLPMAVPLLLAIGLGLFEIGRRSIWLDESASIFVAEAPTDRFLQLLATSKLNMSLYFLALRGWSVLGSGEAVVRALSVLMAAAAVPFLYLTVRRLLDGRTAVVAALLLAVNAFFVEWAQQARGYGLAMLLAAAATYFFVRLLDTPGERRWWFAYGIAIGLSVYAHVFAGLLVAAHALALLLCWRQAATMRGAAAGFAVAAILAAPMVAAIAFGRGAALDWVAPLSWPGLRSLARLVTGGSPAMLLYLVGVGLAAVVLVSWLRQRDPRARGLVLLMCLAFLPFLLAAGVSLVKPVLVPRYLLPSLPFLAALVAAGYLGLVADRMRVVIIGLAIVVVGAWSLPAYYREPDRTNFRRLTITIAEGSRPGDAITWWRGFHSRPSVYYARRFGVADRMPEPIVTSMSWIGNPYAVRVPPPAPTTCLPVRVWLVGGPQALPDAPTTGRAERIRELLASYRYTGFQKRFGTIRLRLFELATGTACPIG